MIEVPPLSSKFFSESNQSSTKMPALRGGFLRFDEQASTRKGQSVKAPRPSLQQDQSQYPLLICEDSNGVSPANSPTRWDNIDLEASASLEWPIKMNSKPSAWPPLKVIPHKRDAAKQRRRKPRSSNTQKSNQKLKPTGPPNATTSFEDFSLPGSTTNITEEEDDDDAWVPFSSSSPKDNGLDSLFSKESEEWPYDINSETQSSEMGINPASSHGMRSNGGGSKTKQRNGVSKYGYNGGSAPKTSSSKYLHPGLEENQTLSTAPTSSTDWFGTTTSSELSSTRSESYDKASLLEEESHILGSSSVSFSQEEEQWNRSNELSPMSQSKLFESMADWQIMPREVMDMPVGSQLETPFFVVQSIHDAPGASVTSELTMDRADQKRKAKERAAAVIQKQTSADNLLNGTVNFLQDPSMEDTGELSIPLKFSGPPKDDMGGASAFDGVAQGMHPSKLPDGDNQLMSNETTDHANGFSTNQFSQPVSHQNVDVAKTREAELLQRFVRMAAPIINQGAITIAQEEPIRIAAARLGIPLESADRGKSSVSSIATPTTLSSIEERSDQEVVVSKKTSKLIQAATRKRRKSRCMPDVHFLDSTNNADTSVEPSESMIDSEADINSKYTQSENNNWTTTQSEKSSNVDRDTSEDDNASSNSETESKPLHVSMENRDWDDNFPAMSTDFGQTNSDSMNTSNPKDAMSTVTGSKTAAENDASDAGVATPEPKDILLASTDIGIQGKSEKYSFIPIPEREEVTIEGDEKEDDIIWPAFPGGDSDINDNDTIPEWKEVTIESDEKEDGLIWPSFPGGDSDVNDNGTKSNVMNHEPEREDSSGSGITRPAALESVPGMGTPQCPPVTTTTGCKFNSSGNGDPPTATGDPPCSSPENKLEPKQEILAVVTMQSLDSLGSLLSPSGSDHAGGSPDGSIAERSRADSTDSIEKANIEGQTTPSSEVNGEMPRKETPIGSSLQEIELLNQFLEIVGPDFNGAELSIIERERIHDQALQSGMPESFLNKILDQSAGIRMWEEGSVVSTSSMVTGKSSRWRRRHRKREPNTPGGGSVKTKTTVSTYASTGSGLSVFTRDDTTMGPSDVGNWTCMFNLQKHFWSDLQSQMVRTVGTVMSGDESESIHSDDLSWEIGAQESTESAGPIPPP